MKKHMKLFLYVLGLFLLASGLVINTKSGCGAAPMASLPLFMSIITDINYGNWTLLEYAVLVLAQVFIKGKDKSWIDLLQIVYAIIFTRVMNLFSFIPAAGNKIIYKIIYVILANAFVGVGSSMILTTGWITNPADSFVNAISKKSGKSLGFVKNCVDVSFAFVTLCLSLIFTQSVVGIGIGTVVSALLLGRIIWASNNFIFKKSYVTDSKHKEQN